MVIDPAQINACKVDYVPYLAKKNEGAAKAQELISPQRWLRVVQFVALAALATLALGLASRFGANLPPILSTKEAWIGMVSAGSAVTTFALIAHERLQHKMAPIKKALNQIFAEEKEMWESLRKKYTPEVLSESFIRLIS